MKLCVAQTRPVKGDIQRNIGNHKRLIDLAIVNGANAIFFPELSITGYEPELANDLATNQDDGRFGVFQEISNDHRITIGVGMPIQSESGIRIGMIIFQPHEPRQTYAKQHLHTDEYPYFVTGDQQVFLIEDNHKIAPAICYELSVSEHAGNAHKQHADIYVASVAKTEVGVEKAVNRLADVASNYSMTVLMANCVGRCDNFESAGKSSVWNNKGVLVGQLDDAHEGILIIDTDTQEIREMVL